MYYSARLFIVFFFLILTQTIQATQAAYPPQYIRSEIVNPASRVNNNSDQNNHDSSTDNDKMKMKWNTNTATKNNNNNNSFQTVRKVSGSQPVRSTTTTKKYY